MTTAQILITAAVSTAGLGAVAAIRAVGAMRALYPQPLPDPGRQADHIRKRDADRLTAAVLLDNGGTEVSDFLLPYELLAASGAFDTYAVAPDAGPAVLTGGLDVIPDTTLDRFDHLTGGHADLVVVPHMPDPDPRLIDWIAAQSRTGGVVLSICTGAGVVARSGVFDGRRATAHWGDLARFERRFPTVDWIRGVRYVVDGDVVASAGITSGADATLHMIDRLAGPDAMHRAADAVGYTDLRYVDDPATDQYTVEPADVIAPLTAALGRRPVMGVLLRDGVHESALAAAMDTYGACFTARTLTVTRDDGPVTSRHGLRLVARSTVADARLDRVAVPAAHPARSPVGLGSDIDGRPIATLPLPASGPPHHAVRTALDDLARRSGTPIARFAAKRLEVRDADLPAEASGWIVTCLRLLAAPLTAGTDATRRALAPRARPRSDSTP